MSNRLFAFHQYMDAGRVSGALAGGPPAVPAPVYLVEIAASHFGGRADRWAPWGRPSSDSRFAVALQQELEYSQALPARVRCQTPLG